MMKRRSFIAGLLALIPTISVTTSIPAAFANIPTTKLSYALDNYSEMIRVVESFPKVPVSGSIDQLQRMHFLTVKKSGISKTGIMIENQTTNTAKEFPKMHITIEAQVTDPTKEFMLGQQTGHAKALTVFFFKRIKCFRKNSTKKLLI